MKPRKQRSLNSWTCQACQKKNVHTLYFMEDGREICEQCR